MPLLMQCPTPITQSTYLVDWGLRESFKTWNPVEQGSCNLQDGGAKPTGSAGSFSLGVLNQSAARCPTLYRLSTPNVEVVRRLYSAVSYLSISRQDTPWGNCNGDAASLPGAAGEAAAEGASFTSALAA